jgi:Protein of unknown function (DUF2934)
VETQLAETRLQITRDQLQALMVYTGRSLCRLIGCTDEDSGEVLGSGTFIDVRGSSFLATACHVIHQQYDIDSQGNRLYNGIAHDTGAAGEIFRITNPIYGYGGLRDVAVARLFNEDFAGSSVFPLPLRAIPKRTPDLKDEILFVHGFPGKKSRFVRAWQGIVSESFPWVATEEPTQCTWFDPTLHMAIGYPAEAIDERGIFVATPNPQGLSGSAIWKTNVCAMGKLWTPQDAEMIGVVTDWDMGTQTLIAVRIEYFWTLLLHAIQQEGAYFRWLSRDKAHGEDLADWFAAGKDLEGL